MGKFKIGSFHYPDLLILLIKLAFEQCNSLLWNLTLFIEEERSTIQKSGLGFRKRFIKFFNMKIFALFVCFLTLSQSVRAQDPDQPHGRLLSGPMLGYIEHRETAVWLEVSSDAGTVKIEYWNKATPDDLHIATAGVIAKDENTPFVGVPLKFVLGGLDMGSEYAYRIEIDDQKITVPFPTSFKTKTLWEWRTPAPDFSFLLGSCFYMNDAPYDRPGKPYGKDPSILEKMGDMPTDFMLWMGDNLYFREADYSSPSGMDYRYSFNFRAPEMQKLRGTRANYAIWDDHDFGSDDCDKTFEYKEYSLEKFKEYWANKTYGEPDVPGIYSKFKWSDSEFFLTDNRYHRSPDFLPDSTDGKPNPEKRHLGARQMEWLKNSLIFSDAVFKFVVVGGQVLNPMNGKESLYHFPVEYHELMNFIRDRNISGVIFLTGDRHFSELIKNTEAGSYNMYDFTCSSVTAGPENITKKPEFNNPLRVPGSLLMENNFGKISVSGKKGERKLILETFDVKGVNRWRYEINQRELKSPGK